MDSLKNWASSLVLQTGQTECLESQVSAHWTWNPWLQPGISLACCSLSISSRQTAHSVPSTKSFAQTLGSFSSSASDNPVFLTGFSGDLKSLPLPEKLVAYHKRQMYTMKTTLVPTHGKNRAKKTETIIFFWLWLWFWFWFWFWLWVALRLFLRVVDREVNVMGIEVWLWTT